MLNYKTLITILESFVHAGAENESKIDNAVHSEDINEKTVKNKLSSLNGLLVAPGFGERVSRQNSINTFC